MSSPPAQCQVESRYRWGSPPKAGNTEALETLHVDRGKKKKKKEERVKHHVQMVRRRLARPMSAYADVRRFTRPRTASPSSLRGRQAVPRQINLLSGLVFERPELGGYSSAEGDDCGTPGSWNPASGGVMFLVGLMAGSCLDLSGRQPLDGRPALPGWHAPTAMTATTATETETRNRLVRF